MINFTNSHTSKTHGEKQQQKLPFGVEYRKQESQWPFWARIAQILALEEETMLQQPVQFGQLRVFSVAILSTVYM
jgi:hypothetical protein